MLLVQLKQGPLKVLLQGKSGEPMEAPKEFRKEFSYNLVFEQKDGSGKYKKGETAEI